MERTIRQLNENGYRVVFVVPDHWSIIRRLINWFVLIGTDGIIGHAPGVLIVGEKVADPQA